MAEALQILSSKPKRKDINKYNELDEKWYSFGVELDVEDEELDNLEKHSDPHKRLIKMFSTWLENGENPTYRQLLRALVNVGKRDVAESIRTDIGRCVTVYFYLIVRKSVLRSHCIHGEVLELHACR